MYKKSIYNICIGNVSDNKLYYNSFTGSISLFDNKSLNFLENISLYDDNSNEEDKQLKNLMYENGFIVNDEFDELNWIILNNKSIRYDTHPTKIRLTVAPTMLCNYNCYYCYESRVDRSPKMSDEVIDDLLNYIESQITDELKELCISWYGGEPLLAIDVIKKISIHLITLCNQRGIKYKSDILTNGYLLDYDTAVMLHDECNITSVQIPMDGMAQTYSERKGVSKETFDKVINNICKICNIMKVHIRMNVDNNNKQEIYELARILLINCNLKDKIRIYLAPVKNYSNVCNFIDSGCFSDIQFLNFKLLFSEFLKDLDEKVSILTSIRMPSFISCGLSRVQNLIIDSDGIFYRCAHLIGHKEHAIGNVKIGQVFNDANMKFLNMEIQSKCKMCNMLPVCMGGCYFERLLNNDDSVCRDHIERIKHDIMLALDYIQE